jgi:hypothetical protein
MSGAAGAAWRIDPYRRHELRYWDGRVWTDHVSDLGVLGHDPVFPVQSDAGDRFLTARSGRRWSRRRPSGAARPTGGRPGRPGRLPVAGWAAAGFFAVVAVAVIAGIAGSRPANLASRASAATSTPIAPRVAKVTLEAAGGAAHAGDGTALAALDSLPVKGRGAAGGHRADFGQAWADVDRNGCDTRNDVLRRDLTSARFGTGGCRVLTGVLHDPYTGKTLAFVRGAAMSSMVQIDHVVALNDAWQTGAAQLSLTRRTALANDPLNLIAVSGSINDSKGAGDAATWLPPNKAFRCTYVSRQVAVKAGYGLWVTSAERDAIRRVLLGCAGQALPTSASVGPPSITRDAAPSSTHPAAMVPMVPAAPPAPAAPPVANNSSSNNAQVFANCAALNVVYPHGVGRSGASDHTASGSNPVTDFVVDDQLYAANPGRHGDQDGVACEKH